MVFIKKFTSFFLPLLFFIKNASLLNCAAYDCDYGKYDNNIEIIKRGDEYNNAPCRSNSTDGFIYRVIPLDELQGAQIKKDIKSYQIQKTGEYFSFILSKINASEILTRFWKTLPIVRWFVDDSLYAKSDSEILEMINNEKDVLVSEEDKKALVPALKQANNEIIHGKKNFFDKNWHITPGRALSAYTATYIAGLATKEVAKKAGWEIAKKLSDSFLISFGPIGIATVGLLTVASTVYMFYSEYQINKNLNSKALGALKLRKGFETAEDKINEAMLQGSWTSKNSLKLVVSNDTSCDIDTVAKFVNFKQINQPTLNTIKLLSNETCTRKNCNYTTKELDKCKKYITYEVDACLRANPNGDCGEIPLDKCRDLENWEYTDSVFYKNRNFLNRGDL